MYVCISKTRHLSLNELYFGFFQTFEDLKTEDFEDSRVDKQVTTDTLIEFAELVLKNNIFELSDKIYKQIRGTAIGTNFAPPCAVLFMAALEEKILSEVKKKPSVWWRYIDDIFFIWEHGEESYKEFINEIDSFHPTRQTGQRKKLIF